MIIYKFAQLQQETYLRVILVLNYDVLSTALVINFLLVHGTYYDIHSNTASVVMVIIPHVNTLHDIQYYLRLSTSLQH